MFLLRFSQICLHGQSLVDPGPVLTATDAWSPEAPLRGLVDPGISSWTPFVDAQRRVTSRYAPVRQLYAPGRCYGLNMNNLSGLDGTALEGRLLRS